MRTATAPIAVKIDLDLKERIKHLANTRHRTPHWMMKEAIREYVEREEKQEKFRQDGLRAWDEYQATGLHVTGDEVIAWLSTWGEENETAAPQCHK